MEQLKEDAIAAARDFSSRVRQLEVENGQLKQQLLQHQHQQQQQTLQAAAGLTNDASPSKQHQHHHDVIKLMEQAHVEQQNLTSIASAAQMECDRLQQQLAASTCTMVELQDTVKRQQRQIEDQQQQIKEWQLHVEEERIISARSAARASAAEAEIVRISHSAVATAAAAEKEIEDQQQRLLNLQELLQKKCECPQ